MNPESYKAALQSKLGFQVIEIIQSEVISAANNSDVLIHCRVNPNGQLQFNLKAKAQEMLMPLEKHLQMLSQQT